MIPTPPYRSGRRGVFCAAKGPAACTRQTAGPLTVPASSAAQPAWEPLPASGTESGTEDAGTEDAGSDGAGREDAGSEEAGSEEAGSEEAGSEEADWDEDVPEDPGPEELGHQGNSQAARPRARAALRKRAVARFITKSSFQGFTHTMTAPAIVGLPAGTDFVFALDKVKSCVYT